MKRHHRINYFTGYGRFCLLALLMTFAAYVFSPKAAEAQQFYEGKTVRIIVPFSAGGSSDIASRVLARSWAPHTPGKPTIIVENMTGAGGRIALNYVYGVAKADGMTILIATSSAAIHQLVGTRGVKYDLAKFKYIGNLGPIVHVFVVHAKLPIKSLADFNKLGRTVAIGAGSSTSTSTVIGRILLKENYNVSITKGYRGESGRYKALLSGEVDAALLGTHMLRQDPENIRPLLWIKHKMPPWTNLPNLEDLPLSPETRSFIKAITIPPQYGRSYVMHPKTAKEPLAILRIGFERAVKDPVFKKRAAKVGVPVVKYGSPEEAKNGLMKVFETKPEAIKALKKVLGERKKRKKKK